MFAIVPVLLTLLPTLAHAEEAASTIARTDKGLSFSHAGSPATLNLDVNLQPWLVAAMSGDDAVVDQDRFSGSGFRLRRALLLANGRCSSALSYRLRLNFASTQTFTDADGKSRTVAKPTIDDAMVALRLAEPLTLSAGRFKVPFSAQWQTALSRQAFMERPLVTEGLKYGATSVTGTTPGRDLGGMLSGVHADKKLDWSLGVFSGDGGAMWPPADTGFLWAARVAYSPLGAFPLDEYDIGRGDARLGLGLSAYRDDTPAYGPAGAWQGNARQDVYGAELRFAAHGLMVMGEAMLGQAIGAGDGLADAATSQGWYAQASWVAPGGQLAPALRVSQLDPDLDATGDRVDGAQLALNWLAAAPEGYAGKEFGERHRVTLEYATARQQDQDGLLVHQLTLGLFTAL